jgi:hypothetical protein
MAFSVTGSKYGVLTISAVGTTTVTIAAATFVSGDFSGSVYRIVGLWSAANVFKGYAHVRKFNSTTVLQLESEFFDPATGITQTQVVGDKIMVSKNFADSVTAGLAVTNDEVAVTDTMTLGIAGNNLGVCFHDQYKNAVLSTGAIWLSGGLIVFGRLVNYADESTTGGVTLYHVAGSFWSLYDGNIACNFMMYGGKMNGIPSGGGIQLNNTCNTIVLQNISSRGGFTGRIWGSNETRHQLINPQIQFESGIFERWGTGIVRGGSYRVLNNGTVLSFTGADTAGNFTRAAAPGKRAVLLDAGNMTSLTRSGTGLTPFNFDFTNYITTKFNSTHGTNRFYFQDSYTNLLAGSVALVLNNSGTLVDSTASSGTTYSPALLRRTVVIATQTINATSWTYGFKKYGYAVISGTITPTTYSLGVGGNADNVTFGGIVNQVADSGVTLSLAAAQALTIIASTSDLYDALIAWGVFDTTQAQYPSLSAYPAVVTGTSVDLGSKNLVIDATAASVLAINTGTNTITIECASLAATSKFDSVVTTGTISFLNGAVSPARLSGQITISATGITNLNLGTASLTFSSVGDFNLRGSDITGTVTLINTSGSPITVQLPPGTSYVNSGPSITVDDAVLYDISVTGLVAGSRVRVYNVTKALETYNAIVAGTSIITQYSGTTQYEDGDTLDITVTYQSGTSAKLPYTTSLVVGSTGWSALIAQVDDTIYNGFALDGSTITEFTADYPNVQVDVDDTDNITTLDRLYAWFVYIENTSTGIASVVNAIEAIDSANFTINGDLVDLAFDNRKTDLLTISGGFITKTGGALPLVASGTIGSIYFDSGKAYIANGITKQQVRDSMALATSETPASGSIDSILATKATKSDVINASQF